MTQKTTVFDESKEPFLAELAVEIRKDPPVFDRVNQPFLAVLLAEVYRETVRFQEREELCKTMNTDEKNALIKAEQKFLDAVRLLGKGVTKRELLNEAVNVTNRYHEKKENEV